LKKRGSKNILSKALPQQQLDYRSNPRGAIPLAGGS